MVTSTSGDRVAMCCRAVTGPDEEAAARAFDVLYNLSLHAEIGSRVWVLICWLHDAFFMKPLGNLFTTF